MSVVELPETFPQDFLIEVAKGNIAGHSLVHKFGHNDAVGTTLVPISLGGIYRTPQVAGATALRIKAGDANDTAAGSGAREVTLEGLDETGALVIEPLITAGASASANTSATFIRLFRVWVSSSGTYASATAGSHAANIVVENAAGTEDWATIEASVFPASQSEIGAYSVPIGFKAYVLSAAAFSDSSKITSIFFFQRKNILETVPPYTAMRLVFDATVEGIPADVTPRSALDDFVGPCDIGIMGLVNTGSALVHVDIEILLVADGF